MATELIAFPFRLGNTGAVQTIEDGTDDYYAQELALLCLTRPGERVLVPTYGITDPTFQDFDPAELEAKVDSFGPPVKIVNIDSEYPGPTRQDIVVEFEPLSEGAANAASFIEPGV